MTIQRFDITTPPLPVMSRCVVHDNNVYLAGVTARDFSGGVGAQLSDILTTIDNYLEQVGSNKSKILTAQVWIADMALVADMNAVWNAWVDPARPPARACVSGELFRPDVLVEVQITAVTDGE